MNSTMDRLLKTITLLRSDKGCSWDRKQTHESLIPYLQEESGEVIEAILAGDSQNLKEELGDLLLQILLHAEIADEKEQFTFKEVAKNLNDKLIRRHPHVFAGRVYHNEQEQKEDWERIKKHERKGKGKKNLSLLDEVSLTISSIKSAYDLQKKAASIGFDWPTITGVLTKVEEEFKEFKHEVEENHQENMEAELGDILFSLVNLARHLDLEPERALWRTNVKFKNRFSFMETLLKERLADRNANPLTLEELDKAWNMAKHSEELS